MKKKLCAMTTLNKVDSTIKLYETFGKRFELTSEYRKRLDKIVDINNEYEAKIAEIAAPKKYFEKSADLTETEQLKIIFKILTEQEENLTKEVIFKDILDMDHFKDYMKSIIRAFKTPSIMGYKPTYKTDYIWVTVSRRRTCGQKTCHKKSTCTSRLRHKRSFKNHHCSSNRITRSHGQQECWF